VDGSTYENDGEGRKSCVAVFRNSFAAPEAFKPNKIEKVRFELPDVAHTFLKGIR